MLKSKSNNQRIILLGLSKTLDQNPPIYIYIYIYIYKNKPYTYMDQFTNRSSQIHLTPNTVH